MAEMKWRSPADGCGLDKALKCVEISCWKVLGVRVALLGSDGLCVFTHSIHAVECAREVRAAWRALLPASEGAGVGAGW